MKNGFRVVGHRKEKLLMKIFNHLEFLNKKGLNPMALIKIYKFKLPLENKYTTKQLSGVLSELKQVKWRI